MLNIKTEGLVDACWIIIWKELRQESTYAVGYILLIYQWNHLQYVQVCGTHCFINVDVLLSLNFLCFWFY